MPKANVLSLVAMLGRGQEDAIQTEKYYADLMWNLTQTPAFVTAALTPIVAGTAEYTWPDDAATLVAVFVDDEWIRQASVDEVEIAFGEQWRDRVGRPLVYVAEPLAARTIRLCPVPNAPSDPLIPVHGAPLGLDYPRGVLCWFVTTRRDDVPTEFDLPLALSIVGREFARESNHRDAPFAASCGELSSVFNGWLR